MKKQQTKKQDGVKMELLQYECTRCGFKMYVNSEDDKDGGLPEKIRCINCCRNRAFKKRDFKTRFLGYEERSKKCESCGGSKEAYKKFEMKKQKTIPKKKPLPKLIEGKWYELEYGVGIFRREVVKTYVHLKNIDLKLNCLRFHGDQYPYVMDFNEILSMRLINNRTLELNKIRKKYEDG